MVDLLDHASKNSDLNDSRKSSYELAYVFLHTLSSITSVISELRYWISRCCDDDTIPPSSFKAAFNFNIDVVSVEYAKQISESSAFSNVSPSEVIYYNNRLILVSIPPL